MKEKYGLLILKSNKTTLESILLGRFKRFRFSY